MKTSIKQTFALGFNVDFSEDSEPTEELGDSAGALGADAAVPPSDISDAELTDLPRDLVVSAATGTLPDLSSVGSPVVVFSSTFVEALEYFGATDDTPEPSLLASNDDCKSTYLNMQSEQQSLKSKIRHSAVYSRSSGGNF